MSSADGVMPANLLELIHVAPPSAVRQRPSVELKAHALFGSLGWTRRRATSATGPLTFDHVAPPSVLRKTPAELPAQTTAGAAGRPGAPGPRPPRAPGEVPVRRGRKRGSGATDVCRASP